MPTLPCWNKDGYILKDETDKLLTSGGKPDVVKTIGLVGGISLLLNNITGPAMVTMPLLYQNAGWFTPTLCIIIMTVFGTLASSFMCEAMAAIPGNHHFEGRVEFSTLVADDAIIAIFKHTCGLQIYPSISWQCVTVQVASDSPFCASSYYLFTAGFLFMMLIVIPMGLLNLDDNIIIQILADVFLLLVTTDFLVTFIMHGLHPSNVPMFKASGQSPVLGVIMANYAFVTTVPSWCSEKKREVSVNKSLWTATIVSSTSFFILGYFGALSFTFPQDGDILSVINFSPYANLFTRVLVYLFPLMILATTIPVFSIIVRYNLLQSKFHKGWANLLAVVLPWIVVIPFLTGNGLNDILNWGTLLFTSIANFIIPFAIYIQSHSFKQKQSELNENQIRILKELKLSPSFYGSINEREEDLNPYRAIPENNFVSSRTIAIFSTALLSVLVVCVIALNIQTTVEGYLQPTPSYTNSSTNSTAGNSTTNTLHTWSVQL